MVSGDHFKCACDYEWRTRKDIGEPSICPRCKSTYITNVDQIRRNRKIKEKIKEQKRKKLKEEAEEKEFQEKRKKELEREKRIEKLINKLKKGHKFKYFLIKYRFYFLILLFVLLISLCYPNQLIIMILIILLLFFLTLIASILGFIMYNKLIKS
ncbi:hypothetical protein HN385_04950 [archaeon]|jgi:Flp pilus assembly protein TadB|nr:hypothetical protein [archaeon]MBT4540809.1 hypothetical protein [Candidatus Woesearchaeota archaeon]MBT3465044.1 hypothetical protein [archaeon]MBT6869283.1 hypothetical protein [archaeon]MBT7381207.1 hypothetical protein [archaeon]